MRTEGGNKSCWDPSWATAAAISRVGSSRQAPSAASRGTSHCRSRHSLSVSSRYNGCPPVRANRKSPSATNADASDAHGSAVEGWTIPSSCCSPSFLVPCSPAIASRSWRVSGLLSGCKGTWLSGRSRPRSASCAESCGLSSNPSLRTVPSSSTRLPCSFQEWPR